MACLAWDGWRLALCCWTLIVAVTVNVASAEYANVVEHQAELAIEYFGNSIHPYAWSHKAPDPYYSASFDPFRAKDVHSFLEVQTYIPSKHNSAAGLLQVSETIRRNRKTGFIGGSTPDFDPADDTKFPSKLKPNHGYFGDPSRLAPGTFPEDHHVRAVYGPRRRRTPYDITGSFGSLNPYRQANNWRNSPNNVMITRKYSNPWKAVRDPALNDFAKIYGSGGDYYGGYSSFRLRGMRRRVSDVEQSFPLQTNYPASLDPAYTSLLPSLASADLGVSPYIAALNPLAFGPSPYIPGGDYKFFNFYRGRSNTAWTGGFESSAMS